MRLEWKTGEAMPIKEYLKLLDRPGGSRETMEILETLPRISQNIDKGCADNAFVCIKESCIINGVPEIQIWIDGKLLTCKATDVHGDIAPFFEG